MFLLQLPEFSHLDIEYHHVREMLECRGSPVLSTKERFVWLIIADEVSIVPKLSPESIGYCTFEAAELKKLYRVSPGAFRSTWKQSI